ncbi:MAG: hypothetical protein ACRDBG_26070 [Waterburya sp.]
MATTNKNPRTKRTQPKKCTQTICGNTCIKTGYTCYDNDPNAKKKIRQRGKELVDRIQGKTTSKTKVDRAVEKSSAKTKTNNRFQGKLAYEQLTKDSKAGTKRSKTEAYNQGLGILAKYGGKDDSRTKVDRAVEKASGKTRRKPQTENEKTAKALRREEAQRVLRELQDGEKNSAKTRRKPQIENEITAKAKTQEKERTSKTADNSNKVADLNQARINKAENEYEKAKKLSQRTGDPLPVLQEGKKVIQAIKSKSAATSETQSPTPYSKSKKTRRNTVVDMDAATRKKFNFIGVNKETGKTNFSEIGLGRDRTPQLNQIEGYRSQRQKEGTLSPATDKKVDKIIRELRDPKANFKRQGELLKDLDNLFNNGDD